MMAYLLVPQNAKNAEVEIKAPNLETKTIKL
jgi:hypothetical protein